MISKESINSGTFSVEDAEKYIQNKMLIMMNVKIDYEWLIDFFESLIIIKKKYGKTKNIINVERELGINIF